MEPKKNRFLTLKVLQDILGFFGENAKTGLVLHNPAQQMIAGIYNLIFGTDMFVEELPFNVIAIDTYGEEITYIKPQTFYMLGIIANPDPHLELLFKRCDDIAKPIIRKRSSHRNHNYPWIVILEMEESYNHAMNVFEGAAPPFITSVSISITPFPTEDPVRRIAFIGNNQLN